MKERPINFSGEMVKVILEGRKTQTRRVIKLPRWSTGDWNDFELDDNNTPMIIARNTGCLATVHCPYGIPSDRLWVKETWRESDTGLMYRADGWEEVQADYGLKWKSGRFMPRWASRIMLEVVQVRVERVQELTLVDARAEGIFEHTFARGVLADMDARWKFIDLWESINGKRGYGWEVNPFVWIIEFRRIAP